MANITDTENRSNGAYANSYADTELYLEILIGPEWQTTQLYIQTFDDNASRKLPSLTGVLPGCWEKLKPTLIELNQQGAGIYLTVNETRNGRKAKNFVSARAIWCDWDTPGEVIPDWPLRPHLTTQTSPGKFHFYWLVTGLSDEDHRRLMLTMTEQWGNDPNAKDLTRVLRIPGFYHRKDEPFLVQLCKFEDRSALPPYTREEVMPAFRVPPIIEPQRKEYENTSYIDWEKVIDALSYLDPSMPRQEWLDVGFCLSSTGDPRAFDAWNDWSKGSKKKYQPEIMQKTWESMREQKGETIRRGLTIGTLFYRADIERKRQEAENTKPLFNLTETGLAERFVRQHGEKVRWCEPWKKWVVNNKTRWEIDATRTIQLFAKKTVLALHAEAQKEDDDEKRKKLAKFAIHSESEKTKRAMLELAKSESGIPVLPALFDTDLMLLNVQNGTLDLRTGELRKHDPQDYITKHIPIPYHPTTSALLWEEFLDSIFTGNQELIDWIQRAVGYSLTGLTHEQCFFLCHGMGANGKSTFLAILKSLLGEYSAQAAFQTFMQAKSDAVRNDLAQLHNRRLVIASEAEEGRKLSESVIKQLTGTDEVTARFLYTELFTFTPRFKIWLATNHKPTISGTDYAIWRRVKLIPFNVIFYDKSQKNRPPDAPEQDKTLLTKLQVELPGILAWAVRGCLAWQTRTLTPEPEVVQIATEAYREEQDVLERFITEQCMRGPNLTAPSSELHRHYIAWCKSNSEPEISQTALAQRLKDKKFTNDRNSITGLAQWRGLALTQNLGQ